MRDPYEVLGVARDSTGEQIKNAYRQLAKKFHPDLNPGKAEAQKRFQEASAAYEILGDEQNRRKFDRGDWGREEAAGNAGARRRRAGPFYHEARAGAGERYDFGGAHFSADDIFAELFRAQHGGGARAASMPGQDEHYRLEISPREAVAGGERELTLPGGKRLRVRIPEGVAEGARLRFSGQGGPGFGGGLAGDVYVEIGIAADPRFHRRDGKLVHELSLSLAEAVLGAEVRVPTPEGEVLLQVPPHSNSGQRLRVPGKGLPVKGGGRGDLVIELRVTLPDVMDPELEEMVRAWQARHPYSPRERETERRAS